MLQIIIYMGESLGSWTEAIVTFILERIDMHEKNGCSSLFY